MNDKDYDDILNRLESERNRKKQIQLTKAQAEIEAINRETDAYYDGAYDAIKAIKNATLIAAKIAKSAPFAAQDTTTL